jgi:hypothetical protein
VITSNVNAPAVDGTDSSLDFLRCTIASNGHKAIELSNPSTGGLFLMVDSVVRDHEWTAVDLRYVASVEIQGCTFLRNRTSLSSGGGGAVQMTDIGGGGVRFCTFAFDSAGTGGSLFMAESDVTIEQNTFFGCHGEIGGSAVAVGGPDPGAHNNVFAACTGPRGAVWRSVGANSGATGCNLFWNNETNYFGTWTPSETDLVGVDPEFCDAMLLDLSLRSSSPAAPMNSPECGLIGAHEVGCGTVGVEPMSWGRLKSSFRLGGGP